jgi:acetylornithine/succinyldiaminopimelate/putrescine aminotransferase
MLGIGLKDKTTKYLQALQREGVIAIGGGSNVIRLLPPLVIREDQWRTALTALERVLAHG